QSPLGAGLEDCRCAGSSFTMVNARAAGVWLIAWANDHDAAQRGCGLARGIDAGPFAAFNSPFQLALQRPRHPTHRPAARRSILSTPAAALAPASTQLASTKMRLTPPSQRVPRLCARS